MIQVIAFPPKVGSSKLEVVQDEYFSNKTFRDDSFTPNFEFVVFLRTSEILEMNEKDL